MLLDAMNALELERPELDNFDGVDGATRPNPLPPPLVLVLEIEVKMLPLLLPPPDDKVLFTADPRGDDIWAS